MNLTCQNCCTRQSRKGLEDPSRWGAEMDTLLEQVGIYIRMWPEDSLEDHVPRQQQRHQDCREHTGRRASAALKASIVSLL